MISTSSAAKSQLLGQLQEPEKLPNYRIEYHPRLVEEAVLRAITGHIDERLFRQERDRVYRILDPDVREGRFESLHAHWYELLGLDKPLKSVLTAWPSLTVESERCMLLKAQTPKQVGAELYVTCAENGETERPRRSILLQVTPELLAQPDHVLTFFRRELLHIVDMLDPEFGYEPHLPPFNGGPAYERIVRERYRILWDITVDGRLFQKGWLPPSVQDKHRPLFQQAFSGQGKEVEAIFSLFFNSWPHTHQELMSLAAQPDSWFNSPHLACQRKGLCSLCHFPSFELLSAFDTLSPWLIDQIRGEHPHWSPNLPICRQCSDLYELRSKPCDNSS